VISDETWEYDYNGNAWTRRTLDPRPSQRWFHASVYDTESDAVVVFGGETPSAVQDDQTWALRTNATAWTNTNPGTRPYGRDGPAMAYDAKSDRIILFGGDVSPAGVTAETWAFDLNALSGPSPGVDYLLVGALVAIVAAAAFGGLLVLRRRRHRGRGDG